MKILLALGWGFYAIALVTVLLDVLKYERIGVACCSLYYTFLTHLVYGTRFLQGFLFTKSLVSKLR